MENENRDNQVDLIKIDLNYFKLDYPKQRIKGNQSFEKYKNLKLKELGNDSELFYCKNDFLYFYVSKRDCNAMPFYYKQCPLCKYYICYFCQRTTSQPIGFNANCCIKLRLYYLFFLKGFVYLNEFEQLSIAQKNGFYLALKISLIPFLNLLYLFSCVILIFFRLLLKDKKWRYDVHPSHNTYNDYYQLYNSFKIIMILMTSQAILYSICYTIYSLYFNIFIFMISLFFKFYPLKYIIGILVYTF